MLLDLDGITGANAMAVPVAPANKVDEYKVEEDARPVKRRRVSHDENRATPSLARDEQANPSEPDSDAFLARATHILATEAAALANVTNIYTTSSTAQSSLRSAVSAIVSTNLAGGKLIACGVGKSAYIAQKLIATAKSLSIRASFMHACEALHGDLGDIRDGDVLLFVSFSGKTPELLSLLPHIHSGTRVMALSGCSGDSCPLLDGRDDGVLLPTPIPESEEASFGVAAPTTSTTVALAVADMLILSVAGELHGSREEARETFKRNHPGGNIGMNHREVEKLRKDGIMEDFTVVALPSPSISGSDTG